MWYTTVSQTTDKPSLVFFSRAYVRWDMGLFKKKNNNNNNLSCDILEWWPKRQWNTGSLWNRRVITQPRGSEVTLLCCAADAITDLPPQMDAALRPSALPAAPFNTQVKKIKDARCLVCQRTQLCALFSSFSLRRSRSIPELWVYSGGGKKKRILKEFMCIFALIFSKKYACIILRRAIFHHAVGRFSHRTCAGRKKTTKKKLEGLELFAFSVSLFQREKGGSDLSHMHRRYVGRSGVRGQGSNNITFLRLGFLVSLESSEMGDAITCGAHQANTGVHTSLEIGVGNGRWNSRRSD